MQGTYVAPIVQDLGTLTEMTQQVPGIIQEDGNDKKLIPSGPLAF